MAGVDTFFFDAQGADVAKCFFVGGGHDEGELLLLLLLLLLLCDGVSTRVLHALCNVESKTLG